MSVVYSCIHYTMIPNVSRLRLRGYWERFCIANQMYSRSSNANLTKVSQFPKVSLPLFSSSTQSSGYSSLTLLMNVLLSASYRLNHFPISTLNISSISFSVYVPPSNGTIFSCATYLELRSSTLSTCQLQSHRHENKERLTKSCKTAVPVPHPTCQPHSPESIAPLAHISHPIHTLPRYTPASYA